MPDFEFPEEVSPQDFAQRLNLPIRDYSLITRALTHRSYMNEHNEALEDNERLEFLGDAVLDFLVAAWLYNRFPEKSEGPLTALRSALVHTEQLAAFARQIDLGPAMRLGRGEEESGGRERDKLLCDTFEALVGAIFVDAGVPAVERFLAPLLEPAVNDIIADRKDLDSKSLLQEWAQSHGLLAPTYRLIDSSGPDHEKTFRVEVFVGMKRFGSGEGSSKQAAEKAAASDALKSLD